MRKLFTLIFFIFFFLFSCFSMTKDKLYRLTSKAKTEIAFYAIEYHCSDENPGLEVDSEVAEQIYYSSSCKCAIKSGKTDNTLLAEQILDQCNL